MKKVFKYTIIVATTVILLSLSSLVTMAESSPAFLLPDTGGIGTKILYIIGIILVLGTGVLLISKRVAGSRNNDKEEEEEE